MKTIKSFTGAHEFLSNFYEAEIVDKETGLIFPTSEHLFQARKTFLLKEKVNIQSCETPGKSKRMGKKITLREDWEDVKVNIMLEILREKFIFQNKVLSSMLKNTHDDLLVEGNEWHDNFWGQCNCEDCKDNGKNVLGILLMQVRDEINKIN